VKCALITLAHCSVWPVARWTLLLLQVHVLEPLDIVLGEEIHKCSNYCNTPFSLAANGEGEVTPLRIRASGPVAGIFSFCINVRVVAVGYDRHQFRHSVYKFSFRPLGINPTFVFLKWFHKRGLNFPYSDLVRNCDSNMDNIQDRSSTPPTQPAHPVIQPQQENETNGINLVSHTGPSSFSVPFLTRAWLVGIRIQENSEVNLGHAPAPKASPIPFPPRPASQKSSPSTTVESEPADQESTSLRSSTCAMPLPPNFQVNTAGFTLVSDARLVLASFRPGS
jgi:hypothetical protein